MAFDVSKGKSIVTLYDGSKNLIFEKELIHSRKGFDDLNDQIAAIIEENGQAPEIVFEATGVYSKALERFCQDNEYGYSCLNPLEVHLQTASLRRNKTDKSDAHELAKNHIKRESPQSYQQDDYYDQMRLLSRRYEEINHEINQYKNRHHSLLHLSFPEFDEVFKTKTTLYFNVVQFFFHPELVLKSSRTILRNRIKKCTKKNYSLKKLEEKALQLIEAAHQSYPAIDPDDYRCDYIKQYAKQILELEEEQRLIIKNMSELSEGREEYRILLSIPGIQATTACRLIGELGDLNRFKNNKQVNAYVGIDIVRYQSGNTQLKDRINKRGNKKLRSILYFMIVSMLSAKEKNTNHIVDYYYKLKKQPYNKHHKVAVIACMNKFLKVAFHLIQHDLLYDYEIAKSHS